MAQLQANNYSNVHPGATPTHGRACHHCGSQLTHFARFCGECGASGMNTGPKSVVNFASIQALSPLPNLSPTSPSPTNPSATNPSATSPAAASPSATSPASANPAPISPAPAKFAASAEPLSQSAEHEKLQATERGFQYSRNPNPAFAVTPPPVSRVSEAPNFATVTPRITHVDPTLRAELAKHIMLLARERMFLYLHCLFFLCINLFGFWLSMKAYNEYNADEVTKTIIALTPLMFINSVGLVCLSPIKGTKLEIARLKDKIKYIRVQIEYRNITL